MEVHILTLNFKNQPQDDQQEYQITELDEPLLDRKEAAEYLGLKNPNTLAVWDCTKRYDLRPIKVGSRVRYSKANLIRFLNEQLKEK